MSDLRVALMGADHVVRIQERIAGALEAGVKARETGARVDVEYAPQPAFYN